MSPRGDVAVVLDLWHTLVDPEDHRRPGDDRVAEAARLLGVDVAGFVAAWREREEDRTRGVTPPNDVLFAEAVRREGGEALPSTVQQADDLYGRAQDEALTRPRGEVVQALERLRAAGHRLAVLSNTEARDVRAWRRSPLAALVDVTVFSCDVHALKPEGAAYAAVLSRLGVPADRAVYVGDGGGDELRGARRAGFRLVVCNRAFVATNRIRPEAEQRRLEEAADEVVISLASLPELLVRRLAAPDRRPGAAGDADA